MLFASVVRWPWNVTHVAVWCELRCVSRLLLETKNALMVGIPSLPTQCSEKLELRLV